MDDNNKKTPSSQNAAGAGPETYSQAPPQSVGYPQFPMGYQPQFMYYPMPPYMQGYPQSSMGSPPQETGPHQTPGLPHFGGGYPSFYPGPVPSTPQTGQTGEHFPPSQSAGQPTSSDGRTQVQESGPNQTIGPPYFSGYPSFYTGPLPSMPQAASKFPSQIAGGPKPSKGHPQQPQMMQVPPQMNPWFRYQQYCQPFQPPAGTREYSQPLQSQPPLRQRWESTPNLHQGVTEMQSGLGRQGRQQSLNSLLEEDEFAGGNSGHFRRSNSTCSELGVDTRLSLDRIAVNHDTFPPTSPFSPTTADPLTATEGPPRTVKVGVGRDIQPKLVYEYYFQNAAIGGGQVEQVEIHTEERLVFVTFARAEDAARVSGRSHSIGQESVTVSLHVAPAQRPTYANKLLFHNLPDKLSSHHFRTLLKLVTGCAPVDILYGDEEGALVTFNERQDLERVQKMCQENDLDGRLLSVSRVPVSSAILVGNLNPFTAVETVRFFFHNHNRSGGGPVQNVDMIADECKCIVHFEDHKVIESVLGKEKLTLDDSILTITTYFECLGTSGGSEDPDNFPVPKSFSLKDVARAKLLFFQKCPAFWEELHQLLSELHAVPKCVDDKVVVDCTLTSEVPKARHLARTWKAEAQDAVMKCLVEVIVHEILVPQETWPVVETKLDGVVYGLAIAATKPDDRSLIVVGKEPSLTQLSEDIRATLKKEEAEIERKKLEVEETVTLEPHQIRLLEAIPFQPSQSDILVKTDSQKFVIVFQGNKFSVKDARLQMYELLQSVKAEQWSNISNAKQTLLQNKQGESFIMEKLKGKGVVAVWEIAADQEHITFYAFSVNNVKKAVSIADASLVEDVILCRESADLLQSPEWNDFVKELTDRHAGVLIISTNPKDQKISITCTDDILQSAQKEIHDFRERNTILTEVVCFSKNRQNFVVSFWSLKLQKIIKKLAEEKVQITSHKTNFTVKGTRHGLEEVRKKLQILGQQIFVHKETYTTLAMVKYFRHPECQQGLDLIGSSNKCVIALEFEPDSPLQVKVEDEKKVKFPDGVKVGDIADTKGHGFGGKALYHSTLPHWSSANSKENLREVVTMYLTKASSQRSISMNLSFLDTGQLSYPRDETARIMLDTVDTFQRASPSTSLRDVRIVVKHKDTQALQEFRHVLDGRPTVPVPKAVSSPVTTKADLIKVSVIEGEIAEQKVDVIVNTATSDLNLNIGAVSASLLKKAGQALQDECKTKFPDGVKVGDLAETKGHSLACKAVYHLTMPAWSNANSKENLQEVVSKCLTKASSQGHTSLVFPALGTGQLNYPRDETARIMLDTVDTFQRASPSTSLRDVRIVVYHKDTQTVQEFRNVHDERKRVVPQIQRLSELNASSRQDRQFGQKMYCLPLKSAVRKGPASAQFCIDGLSVHLRQGDILDEDADILVNMCLDLAKGSVGSALAARCGKPLEEAIKAKASELKGGGVAVTPAFQLKCRSLLHVNLDKSLGDLTGAITRFLDTAESCDAKSIALPDIGTEMKFEMNDVANAFLKAVSKFQKEKPASVQELRCIFSNTTKMQEFTDALQSEADRIKKEAENAQPATPTAARSILWKVLGRGKTPQARSTVAPVLEVVRPVTEDVQPGSPPLPTLPSALSADVYVYAVSKPDATGALKALEDFVKDKFPLVVLEEEAVKQMEKSVLDKLIQAGAAHDVEVTVKQTAGQLELHGHSKNIIKTQVDIKDIISGVERRRHEERAEDLICKMVQWSYLEVTTTGYTPQEYEKRQNKIIEEAFLEKQKCAKLVDNVGKTYIIDFETMREYVDTNKDDFVQVIRRDKTGLDTTEEELPTTWLPHPKGENLHMVPLKSSDKEYKQVAKSFMATLNTDLTSLPTTGIQRIEATIVSIDRVQNQLQMRHYMAKKGHMDRQNPRGTQNERTLWHGTTSVATQSINQDGFNRSYCGKNATAFGQGVYFAVNSSYSAQPTYSEAEAGTGNSYIYQCKVLTGCTTKGEHKMRYLPKRNGKTSFDSATNDVKKPSMYVIFSDTQAYPEYLITFKKDVTLNPSSKTQ